MTAFISRGTVGQENFVILASRTTSAAGCGQCCDRGDTCHLKAPTQFINAAMSPDVEKRVNIKSDTLLTGDRRQPFPGRRRPTLTVHTR